MSSGGPPSAPVAWTTLELALHAESVLAEEFGESTQAPAFAAALIVNDNPQGAAGITAIANDTATFVEPEGLKLMISDIRKELGITVLMVEHDMTLVNRVSDRVLALNYGKVLASGTPSEVQAHPDVIAAYLGA